MSNINFNDFITKFTLSSEEQAEKDIAIAKYKNHEKAELQEKQIKAWRKKGIMPKYDNSTWENWVRDTPAKEKAYNTAKTAWNNNILFTGNNGTGKTHLAMCLAKDGATYRNLADIFREIRSDFDSEEKTLDYYGSRKLLIIDEVGRLELNEFRINTLFEIINRRWNNELSTTIITNLSAKDFSEMVGNAILDRFKPMVVHFNWESMR